MQFIETHAMWRYVFWFSALLVLTACGAARWEVNEAPAAPSAPVIALPDRSLSPSVESPETISRRLHDYYVAWRGTPYQFGGTTRRGIDCSAFTRQAMSGALGVKLPRTTSQQMAHGRPISRQLVRPGDLVFFKTGRTLNHVGVMLGQDRFMHASTRSGVTISRIDDRYWKSRVVDYRRVLD